jgi:hypothetical protein
VLIYPGHPCRDRPAETFFSGSFAPLPAKIPQYGTKRLSAAPKTDKFVFGPEISVPRRSALCSGGFSPQNTSTEGIVKEPWHFLTESKNAACGSFPCGILHDFWHNQWGEFRFFRVYRNSPQY